MAAKKRPPSSRKPSTPLRRCSRCKVEKPVGEFPRNASRADGLALYCRPCKRNADRARDRAPAPPAQHPTPGQPGVEQNPPPAVPRLRAPALAITDELIERSAGLIREIGATRRAAARHVGVSENTFKNWLREGADAKDPNDPRARLLFAIETAEGEAEVAATRAYWSGTKFDPQVAQRFLERRFSKGDEKWARTEHLEVSDADRAPMEAGDARKLLADKLHKLFGGASQPSSDSGRADGGDGGGAAGADRVPPLPVEDAAGGTAGGAA